MSETRARLVWMDRVTAAVVGETGDPYLLLPVTFDEDGEPVVHGVGCSIKQGKLMVEVSPGGSFFDPGLLALARQAKP